MLEFEIARPWPDGTPDFKRSGMLHWTVHLQQICSQANQSCSWIPQPESIKRLVVDQVRDRKNIEWPELPLVLELLAYVFPVPSYLCRMCASVCSSIFFSAPSSLSKKKLWSCVDLIWWPFLCKKLFWCAWKMSFWLHRLNNEGCYHQKQLSGFVIRWWGELVDFHPLRAHLGCDQ